MLQPEDGFMKAETCSFYVFKIKYMLYNKFVLIYIIIYSYTVYIIIYSYTPVFTASVSAV
jgi:hypothetical protein